MVWVFLSNCNLHYYRGGQTMARGPNVARRTFSVARGPPSYTKHTFRFFPLIEYHCLIYKSLLLN